MIPEREEARSSTKARITALERSREKMADSKGDRKTRKEILADYVSVYETFDKEPKRQLNQILFSAIVSDPAQRRKKEVEGDH